MSNLMRLAGRTALVTGAGSGIGRAIAVSLAKRGCHLVLTDINEAGVMKTADLVRGYGIRVKCQGLSLLRKNFTDNN